MTATFGNRYQPIRELSRDALGVVWVAQDTILGRQVTIRLLTADSAGGVPEFSREVVRAARLSHPHIVHVYDLVQEGDERSIVMEHLEGESLAQRLARSGPVDEREGIAMGAALAEALAFAHGQSVVHGDVQPSRVLIDASGAPHLADFALGGAEPASTASDVHALAATLYAAVEGQGPYEPLGASQAPRPFQRIQIMAAALGPALSSDPSARPTMAAFAAQLTAFESTATIKRGALPTTAGTVMPVARPAGPHEPLGQTVPRSSLGTVPAAEPATQKRATPLPPANPVGSPPAGADRGGDDPYSVPAQASARPFVDPYAVPESSRARSSSDPWSGAVPPASVPSWTQSGIDPAPLGYPTDDTSGGRSGLKRIAVIAAAVVVVLALGGLTFSLLRGGSGDGETAASSGTSSATAATTTPPVAAPLTSPPPSIAIFGGIAVGDCANYLPYESSVNAQRTAWDSLGCDDPTAVVEVLAHPASAEGCRTDLTYGTWPTGSGVTCYRSLVRKGMCVPTWYDPAAKDVKPRLGYVIGCQEGLSTELLGASPGSSYLPLSAQIMTLRDLDVVHKAAKPWCGSGEVGVELVELNEYVCLKVS